MNKYSETASDVMWMAKEIKRLIQAFDPETTVRESTIVNRLGEWVPVENRKRFNQAMEFLLEDERMAIEVERLKKEETREFTYPHPNRQ